MQCHGSFKNGVVFDITQGFVYGHLAHTLTHNCYVDAIGTKGIARMRHDFKNATVELHGDARDGHQDGDVQRQEAGRDVRHLRRLGAGRQEHGIPRARDSAIASEVSWAMLNDAVKNDPPVRGTNREMEQILAHRRTMRNGYGLPVRPQECPATPAAAGEPPMACGEELCGMQQQKDDAVKARAIARRKTQRKR